MNKMAHMYIYRNKPRLNYPVTRESTIYGYEYVPKRGVCAPRFSIVISIDPPRVWQMRPRRVPRRDER